MKHGLSAAVIVSAALLQACTGGAVTDGQGNRLQGAGNGDLIVNFQNTSGGTTYSTGVDSSGYFGFDGDAPASASNNKTFVPQGTYKVWVSSRSGAPVQNTPFTINHTFNNSDCPDHYVSGQHEQCALYQIELLGGRVITPPAPTASTFLGFKTTVIPVSSGSFCASAMRGFGVTNMSPRYNDITFKTASSVDVPWGWRVTSGNLQASGTIPAGAHGGTVDVATAFSGPPYYIYPNTRYTIAFYAGGLNSSCPAVEANFKTTYDPVPACVIDHNCPVDPGDEDGGSNQGDCSNGMDCCASGLCWQVDNPDP